MSSSKPSVVRRGFAAFWRFVDATRRTTLNLLFLAIVIALLWALFGGGARPLGDRTALVLDLRGDLVEQRRETPGALLLANARDGAHAVQLRDVLTVLDAAAKDPHIGSVVLLTDELDSAGLAMLHEVAAALERVKAAGKPVIAWGGSYNQRQYALAAHASEVYMHPMGYVYLEGFGRYRNYYRDALDKLGVTINLMRVGTYKSYAEPFVGNGPSPAAREADAFLYNALWQGYTADIEKSRKLAPGTIQQDIDRLPALMQQAGGDTGKLSLDLKLVDGLRTRDEIRTMMMKRGSPDLEGKNFRQVSFADYLARQHPRPFGEGVAVVMAVGEIGEGQAGPGRIGGVSTSNLIRQAREDDQVKAVVLRVDSPGGSAYASELIRRELELTRKAGKPVVVSMGSVAASGGYWISMAADEVIADPATVTGSIGVFALLPTAEKAVDKLGIHTAGVTTTWLADAYNPLRPLDPRFGQLVQGAIDHVYAEFTARAAQARHTTPAAIDAVGQGRVWTGLQAKERGLVDRIGSFGDAVRSAAQRARLTGDYRVSYVEREGSAFERLLEFFGVSATQAVNVEVRLGLGTPLPLPVPPEAAREFGFVSGLLEHRTPFSAVTHCMCASP